MDKHKLTIAVVAVLVLGGAAWAFGLFGANSLSSSATPSESTCGLQLVVLTKAS